MMFGSLFFKVAESQLFLIVQTSMITKEISEFIFPPTILKLFEYQISHNFSGNSYEGSSNRKFQGSYKIFSVFSSFNDIVDGCCLVIVGQTGKTRKLITIRPL